MPNSNREAYRAYHRTYMRKRRQEWFADKACIRCGSRNALELDHIDPSIKVTHKVWSWTKARRDMELAKCQALCHACHKAKTTEYLRAKDHWAAIRIACANHSAPCSGCKMILPKTMFCKRTASPRGVYAYCRPCRKLSRIAKIR